MLVLLNQPFQYIIFCFFNFSLHTYDVYQPVRTGSGNKPEASYMFNVRGPLTRSSVDWFGSGAAGWRMS